MNDIFKLFKKRAQAGKSTNIQDVIKDLNEKEQSEMMSDNKFDRNNKSYLSISKSGRLKSKKSQNSRALQEDLFTPTSAVSIDITSHLSTTSNSTKYDSSRLTHKMPIYDQHSDNADSSTSSTSSSFRSSYDEIPATTNLKAPNRLANNTYQYQHNSGFSNSNYPYNHHNSTNLSNTNNYSKTSSTNNSSNLFKRFY